MANAEFEQGSGSDTQPRRAGLFADVAKARVYAFLKQTFTIVHPEARRRAMQAVQEAPEGFTVTVGEATRTLEQNALLWPLLDEVSKSVIWHGRKLDAESWKHIFTSSLKKMDVVPNLEGTGFVALGLSTSKMNKKELSNLIELIHAFMAQQM